MEAELNNDTKFLVLQLRRPREDTVVDFFPAETKDNIDHLARSITRSMM